MNYTFRIFRDVEINQIIYFHGIITCSVFHNFDSILKFSLFASAIKEHLDFILEIVRKNGV